MNFEGIEDAYFFVGQMTAFSNRFQTVADKFFEDISWKQCFALICIKMFEHAPTINELSAVLGSSHQNVKQLLLKLHKVGYIEFVQDDNDKRKQRIILTDKATEFDRSHAEDLSCDLKEISKVTASELADIPFFYYEGSMDPKKMGIMGRMMVKMVTKKTPEYVDHTNRDEIVEIVELVKGLN